MFDMCEDKLLSISTEVKHTEFYFTLDGRITIWFQPFENWTIQNPNIFVRISNFFDKMISNGWASGFLKSRPFTIRCHSKFFSYFPLRFLLRFKLKWGLKKTRPVFNGKFGRSLNGTLFNLVRYIQSVLNRTHLVYPFGHHW